MNPRSTMSILALMGLAALPPGFNAADDFHRTRTRRAFSSHVKARLRTHARPYIRTLPTCEFSQAAVDAAENKRERRRQRNLRLAVQS